MVASRRDRYRNSDRGRKSAIALDIILDVQRRDGEFLSKMNGVWYETGDQSAIMKKIQQRFRESQQVEENDDEPAAAMNKVVRNLIKSRFQQYQAMYWRYLIKINGETLIDNGNIQQVDENDDESVAAMNEEGDENIQVLQDQERKSRIWKYV